MSDTANANSQTILVQQISLRLIKPNPKNRLITQDMIDAMAESLAMLGLINPIKVRPLGDGTYMVFSGHVRRLGALKLGWETIACTVSDKTAKETTIEGIWDNRQSTQTWLDDCRDIENLLDDDPDLTIDQLAKILRTSDSDIKRGKRLLKSLNPASRVLIDQNLKKTLISSGQTLTSSTLSWELTEDPVYRLTDLENPEDVFKALQVVIDQQLTGPKARALSNHLKARQPLEAFNPHKPVVKTSKTKPADTIHSSATNTSTKPPQPHPAHLSPSGNSTPASTSHNPSSSVTPNTNGQYKEPLAQSNHVPQPVASAQTKIYMFKDWLAGVKVIPQLKHKVEKGQTLTFEEAMVLGTYRLGEGLHWFWKEILKPMLKSLAEGLKRTLGKGLYNFIILLVVCFALWKVWTFFHIGFHPINWIESKFNVDSHSESAQSSPVSQPVASTQISSIAPRVEAAAHLASEKKPVKPAPIITYQPAISFQPSVEDPKVLETEMAALPQNCVVKDFPLTPDETMPGDLAASRLQNLSDPDKYTMKIGHGTEKILSVTPTNTNLVIAYKSADALGGFIDGSGQINFFWEDVKVIHVDEVDVETKTPSVLYQCSLIVDGAKNPLTIQCSSAEDLEHLVSTMEYFIRSSRLAHDAQPAGLPYPNQGLVLTNDCLADKLWADSPMDKAGIKLGDMIWSADKNAGLQPERKPLETQLSALTSGSHNLFVVSPSDRDKEMIEMNQTHSSNFNPKRRKVLLTI